MKTIAIVSQKGGAGKTTLAVSLSACADMRGLSSVIIDTDPQGTASQWSDWRDNKAPEVIDSLPDRIAGKVEQARELGADLVVIDTPPHTSLATTKAIEVADLVLIPCRPSAFDLSAIKANLSLIQMTRTPAFAIFTAGAINAPKTYAEAGELVQSYGLEVCPHILPDRASHRHASGAGQTIFEYEPDGKASEEVNTLYKWISELVDLSSSEAVERKTA